MFLNVILPILLLLVIGLIAKEAGILTPPRIGFLNKVAFYVALPALVFHSIYSRALREIFSPVLVLGFCAVLFITLSVGWLVFRRVKENTKRSVAITQSYHGNLGYMGLPVVTMALGGAAGAKASLLLGLGSTIQIPLTTIILVHLNSTKANFTDQVKRVVGNPVLLALIIGLIFSFSETTIPAEADELISLLADAALPLALLGVGASIELRKRGENSTLLGSVVGIKMVLMPLLGWIIFSALGAGSLGIKTGVLMLGMPAAVSTFIYAKELGGDEELASLNISTTTIASIISLSILLTILP